MRNDLKEKSGCCKTKGYFKAGSKAVPKTEIKSKEINNKSKAKIEKKNDSKKAKKADKANISKPVLNTSETKVLHSQSLILKPNLSLKNIPVRCIRK
jgi:hypothetical protein